MEEVNAEKGLVKYSKLIEDNPLKEKATCLILSEDKTIVKDPKQKNYPKILIGLSFALLMIVIGLIAGLLVMDMENKKLAQNLKAQENISQDFKAQTQELHLDLKAMENALNISEAEFDELHLGIEKLVNESQKWMKDYKSKNDSLEKYYFSHLRSYLGSIDLAKQSMKQSFSNETKNRLLLEASDHGNVDQVRLFLELGANANHANINSNNYGYEIQPIHLAAKNGYLEIAKLLLLNGANVNAKDAAHQTPLHFAASRGNFEIAKLLLQNGANINLKTSYYQETPLHYAAYNGNFEIVKLLIEN